MKRFSLFAAVIGCFMVASTTTHAATISVNVIGGHNNDGTGPGSASVTGVAGAVQVGNWNNIMPATGNLPNLIDDAGALTGTSLDWASGSNNTYAATNSAPGGGGSADMMSGFLDVGNGATQSTMTVTGLGPGYTANGYDVRIYFNSDGGAAQVGTKGWTFDDGVAPAVTVYGTQEGPAGSNYPLGGPDGFIGSTATTYETATAANFVLIEGLTGANLDIVGVRGHSCCGTRSQFNGIQITGTIPEPSTLVLAAMGLLGFVGLRPRRRR